ncbi:Uncharacterised protein [Mycobacteroides abscessus subsp. abscessus]|nr:hypothetical protein PHIGD24-3_82 [Mycobacterium phage phiGD24-3]QSM02266.1 hypothetical protein PROPHIGD24-3_44 [Mycobacterium phage prophiGD24-3]QSM04359.1 hypothetical protein PROPHIGD43A-4_45 [Mycobacterium phage prophiGD43A-4]WJJ55799.1 hypothetical protein PROPHIT463_47 [Mycobacterium phage prophiT46-3]SHX56712.1 Uncharacterised protein [Mycobacteroides abscessus subsp. abscessus]
MSELILQIRDVSDNDNHRHTVRHPSDWGQAESIVINYASDNQLIVSADFEVPGYYKFWGLTKDGCVVGDAVLELRL